MSREIAMTILCLILWLAAMVGWGTIVRSIARQKIFVHENLLDWVISCALGIGTISLLALLLGLRGMLSCAIAWIIVAIGVFAIVVAIRNCARAAKASHGKWNWLLLAAIPVAAVVMYSAFVPPGILWGDEPNGYDVLEYHLQVPREWFEAGKITPLSHNVFSYFPFNVEMHYLLAMELRGGPWAGMYLAQLMHASMIALSILAIYALTDEPIAAVAMLAAPWLLLLAPIAYDEGGLLLFGTLVIGLIWRALRDPRCNTWRNWALAGALCGFACGSKLTAVAMLLGAIALASPLARRGKNSLAFVAFALLTFSPWCIRNIAWTKNPFYPEATEVFGRGKFTKTQQERWKLAHAPPPQQRSIGARLAAANDQIIIDWRYGYALLPAALIAIALTIRRRDSQFLLALMLMIALIWIAFTHLQSRFFVLAIPVCALAVGGAVKVNPAAKSVGALVLSIAVIVGLVNWYTHYMPLVSRVSDAGAIAIDRLDWLGTDLSAVPESATVRLVGDARAFIYSRPVSYRTVFDITDTWSGEGEFEVVDPSEIRRLSATYFQLPPAPQQFITGSSSFVLKK